MISHLHNSIVQVYAIDRYQKGFTQNEFTLQITLNLRIHSRKKGKLSVAHVLQALTFLHLSYDSKGQGLPYKFSLKIGRSWAMQTFHTGVNAKGLFMASNQQKIRI